MKKKMRVLGANVGTGDGPNKARVRAMRGWGWASVGWRAEGIAQDRVTEIWPK